MIRCQVARGFMALRPCEGAVLGACAGCGRAMCVDHAVGDRCVECADEGADWRRDPQGPQRYRRRFYRTTGYHADPDPSLYWGHDAAGFRLWDAPDHHDHGHGDHHDHGDHGDAGRWDDADGGGKDWDGGSWDS